MEKLEEKLGKKLGKNSMENWRKNWAEEWAEIVITRLVEDYFVQKALYSNEFFRIMDLWSDQQEQQQSHESLVNRLRI